MQTLLAGYKRFRQNQWPEQQALFRTLAEKGQSPKALIISCIDSRVDPAMIFDTPPGDILVVRNVANLVPPYEPDRSHHGTSAALEFGVKILQIPNIVVMGHSQCGGIRALLDGAPDHAKDFIAPWMSIVEPARRIALQCDDAQTQQQCCEQESIKLSLKNLMAYPWIKTKVDAGHLHLYGVWFSVFTGELTQLNAHGLFTNPEQN